MNLFNYIRGQRKGKEANRLEKAAMRDPFLRDALDGYTKVEGDHPDAIGSLQRRVSRKSVSRKRVVWIWGVAASLLFGVFIGGYYLFHPEPLPEQIIALEQEIRIKDTIPGVLSDRQEELLSRTEKPPAAITKPEKENSSKPVTELPSETIPEPESIIQESMESVEVRYIPVERESNEEMVVVADSAPLKTGDPKRAAKRSEPVLLPGSNRIRGQVTDNDGEPLVGVNVHVDGTNRGTLTDINGQFVLETSPGELISFNYIGYDCLTLPVDTGTQMMIAMNEDRSSLEEVVVVAYGTQKKKKERVKSPKPVVGQKAYQEYLKAQLRYPEDGACKGVKGKVTLLFYVDGSGRPGEIKVGKGLCPLADEEAIRLVREGPDWTPETGEVKLEIRF